MSQMPQRPSAWFPHMSDTLAFDLDAAVCLFGLAYDGEAGRRDKKGNAVHRDVQDVLTALCGAQATAPGKTAGRDPYQTGEWELESTPPSKRSRFADPLAHLDAFRQRGRGAPRPIRPDEAGP